MLPISASPFDFHGASSQILRLSKQIHNDALPILYGENIFYFLVGRWLNKDLDRINAQSKSAIRNVCLGLSECLTTKIALLNSLTGLRSFSIFTETLGLLQMSDPGKVKELAVKKMPSKTLVQDLLRKSRGVEVGVVVCFIPDNEKMLPPDLDGEPMVRYRVRLSGKGAEKKELSLELDFEGWRDYKALMPKVARK